MDSSRAYYFFGKSLTDEDGFFMWSGKLNNVNRPAWLKIFPDPVTTSCVSSPHSSKLGSRGQNKMFLLSGLVPKGRNRCERTDP